jgi:hypothetical protein
MQSGRNRVIELVLQVVQGDFDIQVASEIDEVQNIETSKNWYTFQNYRK